MRPFRTTRDIANLRQGRNDWYQITNATTTAPATVHIFDEIGFFGVTASDFVRDMAGISGDVDLHMNCPGGDVFEAVAIYNSLKQHQDSGTVSVSIDGLAASAASFIAQAASPGQLSISKNASMMIHDAFGMGIGNAADMRQLADLLDQQSGNIASIYADRSGRPADQWRAAMKTETWYVGQDAVNAGLADRVTGNDSRLQNSWDLSVFNSSVDNTPWDASKAWANGAKSDDPAAFYNAICAGKKAGDPATQGAHALPYKYTPSSPPNAAGVRNALARLSQTEGLTNEAEARSTLERLMNEISPSSADNSSGRSPVFDPAPYLALLKEARK